MSLRTLAIATTAFAALVGPIRAHAAASPFTADVVFGDSLSDDGNLSLALGSPVISRFTTNPGTVGAEDVAAHFGLSLSPSLLGGTDFAFGGAGVVTNSPGTPSSVPTLTVQINGYLQAAPKLSPTTLYTVFGGANDIFYHATAAAASTVAAGLVAAQTAGLPPQYVPAATQQIDAAVAAQAGVAALETSTQAGVNVIAAATQELALIARLKAAGAKYIVVFNLPDIGLTPQAQAGGPATVAGLTALSAAFNGTLNTGLTSIGSDIIPVNSFALIQEVVANPAKYGFSNATTPACTTASSLQCTPATLRDPNAASTYVFADGVHPTTAAHALFAQYVIAELAAPQQESLLAEAPLAFIAGERSAIGNELLYDDTQGQLGIRLFATGGYSDQTLNGQTFTPRAQASNGQITAGVDWRLNEAVSVGADLSGGEGTDRLGGGVGRFTTQTIMGSVFGQYQWRRALYLNGAAGFGALHYDDVQRSFKLGPATRIEHGVDNGSTADASVTAGYWFGTGLLHTGPYVSGAYERVRAEHFSETSGDSSAMSFGTQTREALIGELGWKLQLEAPLGATTLYPYASVSYAYDGRAGARSVSAGLADMGGSFSMPGYKAERSWGDVEFGLNARIARAVTVFAAYQGRFSDSSQRYDGASLGVKYNF